MFEKSRSLNIIVEYSFLIVFQIHFGILKFRNSIRIKNFMLVGLLYNFIEVQIIQFVLLCWLLLFNSLIMGFIYIVDNYLKY